MLAVWNSEGLTTTKLQELQVHMTCRNVRVLCFQETNCTASVYFIAERGFLFITFGGKCRKCKGWEAKTEDSIKRLRLENYNMNHALLQIFNIGWTKCFKI